MKKMIVFGVILAFVLSILSQNKFGHEIVKDYQALDNDVNLIVNSSKKKAFKKDDLGNRQSQVRDLYKSYVAPNGYRTSDYVYTPNGNSVSVFSFDEMDAEDIVECNNLGDTLVPEATRIASSTAKYNCHSFAWYLQSTSNVFWMNDPTDYYSDGSYEVSTGEVGDIICYFDNYLGNLHSGIIIGTLEGTSNGVCGDADLKIVRSKWGAWGLYEHRGDQCPYTSSYYGDADYVMYFKPRVVETIPLLNPSTNTTQLIERDYWVPYNSTGFTNYALYHLDIGDTKNYGFEITSAYELDVKLFRKYMQPVNINVTSTYENGTYKISFSEYVSYESYYLRVAFENDYDYGTIHTKIINSHSHTYNSSYSWWNYTQHFADCDCGAFHLEGHAISANSFNFGDQYATCLLCGGPASMGFIGPLSLNNLPTTINGSYILPNGVVVLVDEDFDAYLDGTLVFIYPNIE